MFEINTAVTIKGFEGKHSKTADNHLLGTFMQLGRHPPALRELPQDRSKWRPGCQRHFEDNQTGKKNKIDIANESGRLSQAEIDRMVKDTEHCPDKVTRNHLN